MDEMVAPEGLDDTAIGEPQPAMNKRPAAANRDGTMTRALEWRITLESGINFIGKKVGQFLAGPSD
jgi:hypothetical protein